MAQDMPLYRPSLNPTFSCSRANGPQEVCYIKCALCYVIAMAKVGTTKDPWYNVLGSAYVLNFTELNFFEIFAQNIRGILSKLASSLVLNFAIVRSIAKLCVPRK